MLRRIVTTLILLVTSAVIVSAQVNIWEGTDCKKKVELTPFLASGNSNLAVIVCPGGSYFWHDMQTEGVDVAKWLQQNGISAFVLKYRTAGVPAFISHYRLLFRGNQYPDPQNDLQQAINWVKCHAEEYGIDADKIGAMGFSAGGHLVMSVAERADSAEVRPAFVAAIYPVVTMSASCVHKRSRRALLGEKRQNDKIMRDSTSLEMHVPEDCPPVFLINCKDDPVVKCQNSELLDSALTAKNVTHKYIQYATGGHGFGASNIKGTEECRQWKDEFLKWIKTIKLNLK